MGTRFCPRCKSTNVTPDLSIAALGAGTIFNSYECEDCGWNGIFFPERIDEDEQG
ncbi:MAG: hypothetical protein ACMXYM_05260 [Candidatus Woesearchaeota archaeon]